MIVNIHNIYYYQLVVWRQYGCLTNGAHVVITLDHFFSDQDNNIYCDPSLFSCYDEPNIHRERKRVWERAYAVVAASSFYAQPTEKVKLPVVICDATVNHVTPRTLSHVTYSPALLPAHVTNVSRARDTHRYFIIWWLSKYGIIRWDLRKTHISPS